MKTSVLFKSTYVRPFFYLFFFFNFLHTNAQPDFGKSYINVSKPAGGTVDVGDILEIRASLVVRSLIYDSCAFFDTIPAGTSYIAGTLRVLTNEGKIYKQFSDGKFTAPGTPNDEGWVTAVSPGVTAVQINMGYLQTDVPSTVYRRGRMRNNGGHKPSFYNSATIQVASYRVQVTAATGSFINMGFGTMTYKLSTSLGAPVTFRFPSRVVAIYQNIGFCTNATGVNTLGTEFNGTFGTGSTRNRAASGNVPVGYAYEIFTQNTPNDYTYGIANNTSARTNYTTLNTWAKPDASAPSHRVFTLWDIIGDHTGAVSPTLGNPATDTVANKNGGYMLVINAAYRIDSAFQHTISNLCPNTYYEISFWMRNICSECGCDSNGTGANGAGYIPTVAGLPGSADSSGVKPNLAIALNDIDYYTTGNLDYSGKWEKKGLVFRTGNAQTSFTMKFFNNAPGGGGNDWALDDISVASCSPNMRYSPSSVPDYCKNNPVTIYDTVRSFFNNYVYYKWQRSTNGGTTWTDITGNLGPAVPVWDGSAYKYIVSYTIPVAWTTPANSTDKYRMVVASTTSNLSTAGCLFTDPTNTISINFLDCPPPLAVNLISFSAKLNNNTAKLTWTTGNEDEQIYFDIERSDDGINYAVAGNIAGYNNSGNDFNVYNFADPEAVTGKVYYRIKIKNNQNKFIYSRVVVLTQGANEFAFGTVINPFTDNINFEINYNKTGKAEAALIGSSGNLLKKLNYTLSQGVNSLTVTETGLLPAGIYILKVSVNGETITKTLLKKK
jgi:trimeric autotransporter adhesin